MEKFGQIKQVNTDLKELWLDYWITENVFTVQWWIIIAGLIVPHLIFWKVIDRSRIMEISVVGLVIALVSYLLDQMGASLRLWSYAYTATPLAREVWDPADFSILPICYMLFYQWFPKWKSYCVALVLFGFFGAYVGGNFFQWLGIYHMDNWRHIYSVPIYCCIGVLAKYLAGKLKRVEVANKCT